jgi:NADH:ubiquinone oxidoreductase subunit 6 (subunit J)
VYLTLGAEVVALMQLLVYVGAIVVLVLFALMMTRSPLGARKDLTLVGGRRWSAALVGLGVALLLGGTLAYAVQDAAIQPALTNGAPLAIGKAVFAGWLLPFEVLSLLLLAALVGAIAVSRRGGDRK